MVCEFTKLGSGDGVSAGTDFGGFILAEQATGERFLQKQGNDLSLIFLPSRKKKGIITFSGSKAAGR